MVEDLSHKITIEGNQITADTYYKLLKYVLKQIKAGNSKESIVETLGKSGWDSRVVEFLYNIDNVIDKSEIYSAKQLVSDESSTASSLNVSKEMIDKVENELRNAIKEFSKFDGKLEVEDNKLTNLDEKLGVMRDSVGEIRGIAMGSDKRINNFEAKMAKVDAIIASYDASILEKKFADMEKMVGIQEGITAKVNLKLDKTQKSLEEYNGFMAKIKSQEALLVALENIKDKHDKIQKISREIDKRAGKVEAVFLELQNKVDTLVKVESKVEAYEEMIKDLIKDNDKFDTRIKALIGKNEFEKKIQEFRDDLESVKSVVYELNKKDGKTQGKPSTPQPQTQASTQQKAPVQPQTATNPQQTQTPQTQVRN